ncbi:signal peptide peptidase SppA [Desulfuromonas sp. AOP6]|uniref:signal peptide peptidase SppA n=1 Tax=Desulfuromonas sp. AOP6 TaxID=1566351 RepID=UPI00128A354C|nr:signal peptide peptidase SppA [Desulfuromonas sp. AOP6]BCA79637.1 multidrug transporter [Desulfuromonas sp. AOP6]
MKKRPFLMALIVLGAIFLFFLLLVGIISSMTGTSTSLSIGEKIGVVEVRGAITASEEVTLRLVQLREDNSIKAVVLRVDSPGGGVGPSQEIYTEVQKLAQVKPVVVSMGSVAASGGYYIAIPAHQIVANPGTITGSIGVIMEFTNFQELLQKIGLKSQVVKSGEHKDIGSPVRPMTPDDRQILQSLIDDVHSQFVSAVAQGRDLPLDQAKVLADGRIYTGRQALDAGLVDRLGNMQDAIDLAAELANIDGKPRVVYPRESKPKILNYLVEETFNSLRQGLQEQSLGGMQFIWEGLN